jgi:hypothetical protein
MASSASSVATSRWKARWGTTFMVYFPLASRIESPHAGETGEPPTAARGAVALVLEGDTVVRGMVCRALAEPRPRCSSPPMATTRLDLVRSRQGPLDLVVTGCRHAADGRLPRPAV